MSMNLTLSTGNVEPVAFNAVAGNSTLLALAAGKTIRLLTLAITAGAAGCTFRFTDGVTDLTGTFTLGANGVLDPTGLNLGETAIGLPLVVVVTAGACSGVLTVQRVVNPD